MERILSYWFIDVNFVGILLCEGFLKLFKVFLFCYVNFVSVKISSVLEWWSKICNCLNCFKLILIILVSLYVLNW